MKASPAQLGVIHCPSYYETKKHTTSKKWTVTIEKLRSSQKMLK